MFVASVADACWIQLRLGQLVIYYLRLVQSKAMRLKFAAHVGYQLRQGFGRVLLWRHLDFAAIADRLAPVGRELRFFRNGRTQFD